MCWFATDGTGVSTSKHFMATNPPWLRFLPLFARSRIEHRPELQQILANTGWLFGDKILRMGMGLLVGVWVARYLGPSQFGLFSYVTAFVALFGAIASLGLQGIVVRDLVRGPERAQELIGTAFVLQLIGGLFALTLSVVMMVWLRRDDPLALALVAILGTTLVMKAMDVVKYWFEARVQSKAVVVVENVAFLATTMWKVGLILMEASLLAFVWATFAEAVLVALGLTYIHQRYVGALVRWQFCAERAKYLLRESWPLILSGLAVMVYMRIDQIMLGEMLGDDAVGIYSAAVRISEVWYFVPMAIVASVFPTIIAARAESKGLYRRRVQKLYDLMLMLALIVAVAMSFMSGWVVSLLFGSKYVAAGAVLAVHIWSGIFVFLGVASGRCLILEGLQRYVFYRTMLGAVVNVVMNLLLIPTAGVTGAAIATVISYFFAVFSLLFDARTRMTGRMMIDSFALHKTIRRLTE